VDLSDVVIVDVRDNNGTGVIVDFNISVVAIEQVNIISSSFVYVVQTGMLNLTSFYEIVIVEQFAVIDFNLQLSVNASFNSSVPNEGGGNPGGNGTHTSSGESGTSGGEGHPGHDTDDEPPNLTGSFHVGSGNGTTSGGGSFNISGGDIGSGNFNFSSGGGTTTGGGSFNIRGQTGSGSFNVTDNNGTMTGGGSFTTGGGGTGGFNFTDTNGTVSGGGRFNISGQTGSGTFSFSTAGASSSATVAFGALLPLLLFALALLW
jgi:hypothetical protein